MKLLINIICYVVIILLILILINRQDPDFLVNWGREVRKLKDNFEKGYHEKDSVNQVKLE